MLRTMFRQRGPQDTILNAMARALFVSAWADQQEELRARGRRHTHPGPGGDWMDVAPRTPASAVIAAAKLIGRYEELNGMVMEALWYQAVKADGLSTDDEKARADFGHYLGMQALGHGVSWFDDHKRFPLKIPHVEYSL